MIFFFKYGINSLALNIGPAISCGKYNKNSLNEKKFNLSSYFFVLTSTKIAIIVKVINEIARGRFPT